MDIEKARKAIVDFLKERLSPWTIILFDSIVKGNFRADSDIDIAYFQIMT